MSLRHDTLQNKKLTYFEEESATNALQQLIQNIFYAGVGILSGAIGVALTIAGAIVIQSQLPPLSLFSPNLILLALAAIMVGLGISWLLSKASRSLLPNLFKDLSHLNLQVVMISSALASLLQTLLFMHVL